MPARKPLDYQPQSARIFRPHEEVEQELRRVDQVEANQPDRQDEQMEERTNDRMNGEVNAQQADLPATPSLMEKERRTVRHSFDIYADQLQALGRIQLARWAASGKKPKMGTLVQEALDAYIQPQDKPETGGKTNEGTNER